MKLCVWRSLNQYSAGRGICRLRYRVQRCVTECQETLLTDAHTRQVGDERVEGLDRMMDRDLDERFKLQRLLAVVKQVKIYFKVPTEKCDK